ncbi:MAG: ABC transporter ATP-binding protein [Actinobacteria bacterium]|nr:ABC transporter ATP-binding protein [Actinomycetota bacterium]MCL6104657.1 ABC transporter ATP-binding protein [Actinomycetota bacterium]
MDNTSAAAALMELNSVSKIYGIGNVGVYALDGIDLSINYGEYVAIMGASGSGKSTLMHILGCLDVPTSGSYRLAGRDTGSLDELELAEVRNRLIGFVFQQFHLLPQLSAWRNVEMPLLYSGERNGKKRKERAVVALEKVGLAHRIDHRPTELSGGEQQRVAIARALVGNPSLILADEPTGNLSTSQWGQVLELFDDFFTKGQTVVLITHDPVVAKAAKRIVHIKDGHIIDDEQSVIVHPEANMPGGVSLHELD